MTEGVGTNRKREFVPRREFSIMRLIVGLTLAVHVIVGGWAANRAWWQVRDLYVSAPPGAIRPGWRPLIRVTTSGRKSVTVYVLLAQGARTDTIAVNRISGHKDGFWNPTFITRTFSPRVSRNQVSHFEAGLATLRVEAHGYPQWMRTPPPVIHEMPVHIAAAPAPQP
jgi:hypothetical protein